MKLFLPVDLGGDFKMLEFFFLDTGNSDGVLVETGSSDILSSSLDVFAKRAVSEDWNSIRLVLINVDLIDESLPSAVICASLV